MAKNLWLEYIREKYPKSVPYIETIIADTDTPEGLKDVIKKHYYILYRKLIKAKMERIEKLSRELVRECEELRVKSKVLELLLWDKITVDEARAFFAKRPEKICEAPREKGLID